MFTVQIEYGMGKYAKESLNEAAAVICEGTLTDNAIIRIWREDKTGKLINSCERGC